MNKIKKISIISILIFSLFSTISFAQGTTLKTPEGAGTSEKTPLVSCGGTVNGVAQKDCQTSDLFVLMQSILNLIFIFAGFIAASMFMYAGFLLITSVGNASQIQRAKDIFRRVVIGFLIMFLSYLIVKNLLTNIGAQTFFMNIIK